MARIGIHHDAHTAPRWAATGLRQVRRLGRILATLEDTAARHWPLTAYTALTLATGAYVAAQMARI